jgi:hypothetical protein
VSLLGGPRTGTVVVVVVVVRLGRSVPSPRAQCTCRLDTPTGSASCARAGTLERASVRTGRSFFFELFCIQLPRVSGASFSDSRPRGTSTALEPLVHIVRGEHVRSNATWRAESSPTCWSPVERCSSKRPRRHTSRRSSVRVLSPPSNASVFALRCRRPVARRPSPVARRPRPLPPPPSPPPPLLPRWSPLFSPVLTRFVVPSPCRRF